MSSSFIKKCWHKFLDIFGDIKVTKYPLWVLYDPDEYSVTGVQQLEILNNIKPGDVLLRGYDNYIDGYFIPEDDVHGKYSHAGIYVGENEVVHAISPTVTKCNVLDFLRCDRIAILRPVNMNVPYAIKMANDYAAQKIAYDFDFVQNNSQLYCFELCAKCYQESNIKTISAKILKGLIRRKECFLASSFFNSTNFKIVYEHNTSKQLFKSFD